MKISILAALMIVAVSFGSSALATSHDKEIRAEIWAEVIEPCISMHWRLSPHRATVSKDAYREQFMSNNQTGIDNLVSTLVPDVEEHPFSVRVQTYGRALVSCIADYKWR